MSEAMQADPNAAVLLVDASGIVIRANPSAQSLYGACLGLPCVAVVRPKDNAGRVVCHTTCPRGDRTRDMSAPGVKTHGKVGALRCSTLGDMVVVTIDRLAEEPTHFQRLTPRECQVLALVAQGLTAGAIAKELGIEPSTVRTHVEHCRTKLRARSQAEAVSKAYATHQLQVP